MSAESSDGPTRNYGIDLPELRRRMDAAGLQPRAPLTLERIGAGQSNLTFRLSDGAQSWILRRPPAGEVAASAHDVVREHRVMAALGSTAVPVPPMLGVCDDESVCAVPLVLEGLMDGTTVESVEVALSLEVDVRRRLSANMAHTLTAIHDVDLVAVGLSALSNPGPYAQRQLRRWRRQWEVVSTRDWGVVLEVADALEAAAPQQTETTLVHGDFHVRNVLIDPGSGEIRAVVDWELATLGDPIADLGTMLAYWPQASDPELPIFGATREPGFLDHRGLVDEYANRSGRDVSSVGYWQAFALWKIGVIAEGVRRRALDVPANASKIGPPSTDQIDAVVLRAAEVLQTALH